MTASDQPTPPPGSPSPQTPSSAPPPSGRDVRSGGTFVELPRIADLDADTAASITGASVTRVIVVAGPPECGKTTLLTALYERYLRRATFGGYCFAGSETLIGFEQRCHPSRSASRLPVAETEPTRPALRTPLLHLRLRFADLSEPTRDLLFTDLPGSVFRQAKDSTEACQRLQVLKRADRIVLGVDGGQLADSSRRFVISAATRDFLRRGCDAGMLTRVTRVDVVVLKWDLVEALDLAERGLATATLDRLSHELRDDFAERLGGLRFARVAARPQTAALEAGYGLAELIPAWVREGGLVVFERTPLTRPSGHREIDRYQRPIRTRVAAGSGPPPADA